MVRKPIHLLLPLAMLAGLAACDRPSRSATAPAPTPAPVGSASPAPATASTVALSGAIADLPATTTPDAVGAPTGAIRSGSSVTPMPPARSAAPARGTSTTTPASRTAAPPASGETAAMREFREAQERRDRELLENDLDEVRQGNASDRARMVDEVPPQDYLEDEGAPVDEFEEVPPEGDFDEPPLDDGFDEPPLEEGLDEPPLGEDLPEDELPPEDEELQWDPATGTWR